jgi:hypothetical protein
LCVDAPTDFEVGLQNVTVVEDEPLILECILTKDRPEDQITWLIDNEPLLIDNERIKVIKEGPIVKLIIDECQLTDEGRYQAEINGKTTKSNVNVKGKNIQKCLIINSKFVSSREKTRIYSSIKRYRIR